MAEPVQHLASGQDAAPVFPPVERRAVFYVPGFDPRGARRYRALYASEGRKQTSISGGSIRVSAPKAEDHKLSFQIEAAWGEPASNHEGEATQHGPPLVMTDYTVLRWDDLVTKRMQAPLWRRIARGVWVYARQIAKGAVPGMLRLAKTPAIATLFPLIVVLVYLAVATAIGFGTPSLFGQLFGGSYLAWLPAGLALGAIYLAFTRWLDRYTYAYYLLDFYSMMVSYAEGKEPALEQRLEVFADIVTDAVLSERYDEIVVVGHSGGSFLAAGVLARVIATDPLFGQPEKGRHLTRLALLTLGQTMSAHGQIAGSERQWREFASIARTPQLMWLDVSSKADGASYALCDPLAHYQDTLPSEERLSGPLVLSARFGETMGKAKFKRLRRRFFRLHFQYLYAFESPDDYDYFAITAGPVPLAERYRQRPSNKRAPKLARELGPAT
ncbi:MAG: hypothetical protein AAFV62_01500 [Pseudomonadota bacterium]